MKKALVLGVMAFFAINIATVQTATAQKKVVKRAEAPAAQTQAAPQEENVAATNNVPNQAATATSSQNMGAVQTTQANVESTNNVPNQLAVPTSSHNMGEVSNASSKGKTTLSTSSPLSGSKLSVRPHVFTPSSKPTEEGQQHTSGDK